MDLLTTSKALSDQTRISLLKFLSTVPGGRSVIDLAAEVGLHPNAVRQHLEKLEKAGLVVSDTPHSHRQGRPQRIYRRVEGNAVLEQLARDYRLLSEILLAFIADQRLSPKEIRDFGRRWGQQSIQQSAIQPTHATAKEIAATLMERFSAWGFQPHLGGPSGQEVAIRLDNCIFKEIVALHPDLVCSLLHGVLEGMLVGIPGHGDSMLQNGIAHGEMSCEITVALSPRPGFVVD